jgi:hypothetical protein
MDKERMRQGLDEYWQEQYRNLRQMRVKVEQLLEAAERDAALANMERFEADLRVRKLRSWVALEELLEAQ